MAILRCGKCNHVAEVPLDYIGKQLPCPACTHAVVVHDTALFVRKVLQQYFAMQAELRRFRAAQAPTETAPAELLDLDLHNTDLFASATWHKEIVDWFNGRQIQVRPNLDAVDTTGFFDEVAVEIGDNHELFSEVIDKIRWGQQRNVPNFSLKLGERSQKEGQAINAFCRRLHEHTFLSKYYYQKAEKIGRGSIQSSPAIRNFFAGEWLEWYALMKLMGFLQENKRAFSCTRNLSVAFPNEDLHELDVFFLVEGAPLCIECKTGEFRQDLDKYQRLGKRLGIERSRFILCGTGLTNEQAAGLSSMYEMSFVNPTGLLPHIARLFGN